MAKKLRSTHTNHLLPDGRIAITYQVDGVPSRIVHIEGEAADQAAAVQLTVKELELCERSMNMLIEILEAEPDGLTDETGAERIIAGALYASAVITYRKAFTDEFKVENVFSGNASKYFEFHEWIRKDNRNKYIAHAEKGYFQEAKTIALVTKTSEGISYLATIHATYQPHMGLSEAKDFLRLILFVKKHAEEEVQKCIAQIVDAGLYGMLNVPAGLVYETSDEYIIRVQYPPGPRLPE